MQVDDEDDDDEDEDDDGGFHYDDFNRPRQDPFDDAFRFGFSFGPGGMRFEEPQLFGQIFRDMEEIFAGLGRFDEQHGFGHKGLFALFLMFMYICTFCRDFFLFCAKYTSCMI